MTFVRLCSATTLYYILPNGFPVFLPPITFISVHACQALYIYIQEPSIVCLVLCMDCSIVYPCTVSVVQMLIDTVRVKIFASNNFRGIRECSPFANICVANITGYLCTQ